MNLKQCIIFSIIIIIILILIKFILWISNIIFAPATSISLITFYYITCSIGAIFSIFLLGLTFWYIFINNKTLHEMRLNRQNIESPEIIVGSYFEGYTIPGNSPSYNFFIKNISNIVAYDLNITLLNDDIHINELFLQKCGLPHFIENNIKNVIPGFNVKFLLNDDYFKTYGNQNVSFKITYQNRNGDKYERFFDINASIYANSLLEKNYQRKISDNLENINKSLENINRSFNEEDINLSNQFLSKIKNETIIRIMKKRKCSKKIAIHIIKYTKYNYFDSKMPSYFYGINDDFEWVINNFVDSILYSHDNNCNYNFCKDKNL